MVKNIHIFSGGKVFLAKLGKKSEKEQSPKNIIIAIIGHLIGLENNF